MKEWFRVLIVGAGGHGVLSAGRWLGDAAHACGLPMVVAQLHGMSQRGGSVQSSVAIGGARSPEIPDGMADALVALEPMEGVRALSKLSKRTTAFVNTRTLLPSSLQRIGQPYPPLATLLEPIAETAGSLVTADATSLAATAGSHRALNVVMLGMLAGAGILPIPSESVLHEILGAGLPTFEEMNRKAFELGEEVSTP